MNITHFAAVCVGTMDKNKFLQALRLRQRREQMVFHLLVIVMLLLLGNLVLLTALYFFVFEGK